ncbi:MAG: hypothetical protein OHK0022_36820 [Roseiflexaceae bacterium]
MPSRLFHAWRLTNLLVLALLLGACGRAEQAAQQPSAAPLAPLPTTPEAASATSGTRPSPVIFRPTPDNLQRAATAIAETIETNGKLFHQTADAIETATAAWALTPEPTILPPADGTRLRDLWPASQQQASPPTKLYLRSPGYGNWNPDTFWEVRLPDLQFRRLPAVEMASVDKAAEVSPDGRFLAYVTGEPQRILRVLDLANDTDVGIEVSVINSRERCRRQIAWSPDGHTLAALTILPQGTEWRDYLVLYDPRTSPAPQPIIHLPGSLVLIGWLDAERMLMHHWNLKVAERSRLLVVDRQGNLAPVRDMEPGVPSCARLSPDGRDLIYRHNERTYRLQLATGQVEQSSLWPEQLFWAGDSRTLLVSPFDQNRIVSLSPLDQPEQQRNLFLSPPYQSAYRFGIIGVSPDGSLLVACEQPPSDNARFNQSTARTWLYNIPQDRWTLIRDNPYDWCDRVAGWGTLGGAQ